MDASDNSPVCIITGLDRRAFAVSANLAVNPPRVYQQGFIHLESQP
jgi:hypothetical protein